MKTLTTLNLVRTAAMFGIYYLEVVSDQTLAGVGGVFFFFFFFF